MSFFEDAFFSNEIKLSKPSERIFNFVLEKINAKPLDCVFIDDNKENIEVAEQLGFNVILFESLEQIKKELFSLGVVVE